MVTNIMTTKTKKKRRIFRMAKEINEMFENARRPDQTELAKEAAEFERMMLKRKSERSQKGA